MPVKRKKKRKKVLLHQTNSCIDRLVAKHRTAVDPAIGYSSSQLNGYELLFDIAEDRLGYCPAEMTEQEITEAERMRDIRECYAADTRTYQGLESACKDAGLHVFKLWQHTRLFELKPELRTRAYENVTVKLSVAKQHDPIPIEAGHTTATVIEMPVRTQPAPPDLPVRKRKCKGHVPGNDGECACPACYEYDLLIAEWFKQKWGNPAA